MWSGQWLGRWLGRWLGQPLGQPQTEYAGQVIAVVPVEDRKYIFAVHKSRAEFSPDHRTLLVCIENRAQVIGAETRVFEIDWRDDEHIV